MKAITFVSVSEIHTINEKYMYYSDESIKQYIAPYGDKGLCFKKRDKFLMVLG